MKSLGAVSLLLLWLTAIPAWGGCNQAQELMDRARQEAELSQKIKLLERAVELCPGFETRYALGKAYARDGSRFPQALASLRDAWNQAGETIQGAAALTKAGQVYEEQGETLYAINIYKQALEIFRKAGRPTPRLVARLKNLELAQAGQGLSAAQITKALCFRAFMAEPSIDLRIHFDYDSFQLTSQGRNESGQLARALMDQAFPGKTFFLVGHTDKRGAETYNLELSRDRAGSVMTYLIGNHPQLRNRIRAQGRGETKLLYPGDTEDEHRLNRRVEVRVVR